MTTNSVPKYRCFLSLPHSEDSRVRKAIVRGAEAAGFSVYSADRDAALPGEILQNAIASELARADCIIADITLPFPAVFFHLGLALAMNKGILLVAKGEFETLPLNLREFRVLQYDETTRGLEEFSKEIAASLRRYHSDPQRWPGQADLHQYQRPFFVDWDQLGERELENLCRELLEQMGFNRLEWGKATPEIDLVAELPRKDPDGFEFRELWLVSMGLNAPVELLVSMAAEDPDLILHRILRHYDRAEKYLTKSAETPITLLLILSRQHPDLPQLDALRDRLEKRRGRREFANYSLRFRVWDQAYLTSLVHRFPHIGYKYFSDEGRIRSTTRKSYEELYRESSDLAARLVKLNVELQEEKNKRVRAETDAVWKEISFSAAHKIGNPIFAIETDLEPLLKRIRGHRTPEAEEVVENMRSSVEKAKAFVEQFKSLARAQEITPVPTKLLPILEDACRPLPSSGVCSGIECSPDLTVLADPERLGECFDELVANAQHWFDKPERILTIQATAVARESVPAFLDSSREYALVHVEDNGPGIPVANKDRVFNAFFTTYDHGTGLGLALVRRIIEGHGGGIIESGVPGQGADFEIYIPLPVDQRSRKRGRPKRSLPRGRNR